MTKTLLISLFLLLTGCTTAPDKINFASIAAKNETLKQSYPKRVILSLEADCADGFCTLPESNIQAAADIITRLNDENERRIDAYNQLIGGLTHCEYASAKKDEAIFHMESAMDKQSITHTVKQVLTGALCAGLLIAK
jgi:hypothetical protein